MANTRQPMGTSRTPTTSQTTGNTRQPLSATPTGGARQPIGAYDFFFRIYSYDLRSPTEI